ncbi:MAG: phosphoribosyl-AMP cyclohydrolase, partial [Clostridia bacterium]|nr:phosphoribosyl-AMP cyclohydrolase [Clostridia bacterium]
MTVNDLIFDEKGLIPAIVVDDQTGEVLTLAYMNKESLAITLEKKLTCFYSRSRECLWLKGETSGAYQHVTSIVADCDGDALLVRVCKDGPACHTGKESCFFNGIFEKEDLKARFSFDDLYALLLGRKANLPEGSYTT